MVSFFKSVVVGLTIRKLVYFLDDILSYIMVLMIQITSCKCSKVCVLKSIIRLVDVVHGCREAWQRLLLAVEMNKAPLPPD